MAVAYERYENQIEAAEDDLSLGSDDDPYASNEPPQTAAAMRQQMYKDTFKNRWPWKLSSFLIICGIFMLVLGLAELIILPLTHMTLDGPKTDIHFNHRNLWGASLWAGIILILTGTAGLRAANYKCITSLHWFLSAVMLDILLFSALVILVLISYSQGWTMKKAYPDDVSLFYVHVAISVTIPLGVLLLVLAFTQYYEDVFCGDMQLCRRIVHCCLPCWCPRVVEPEELLDELIRNSNRPPSLPV